MRLAHPLPRSCIEARQLLEGKVPRPARLQTRGNFRRLDDERARSAHGIEHRFAAVKPALAQKQRRHGLAHGRLGDRLLVAALVQQLARRIDADAAHVLLDARPDAHFGLRRDGRPQLLGDGPFDALRGRPRVIDARALAGRLDAKGHVPAQHVAPWEIARALVELGQMQRPEGADARDDATGAADLQVGAPHLGPAALEGDAAGHALGLESLGARLGAQRAFEARNGHEEYLEVAVFRHRACISGRHAGRKGGDIGARGGGAVRA